MSFLSVPISLFAVRPTRKFGEISANVTIDESTNDTLTITKQPVQQGASITDHAYKEPTTFTCTMLFKDNPAKSLSKIYQDLLDLQVSRVPFKIITPKRIYPNMLIATIGCTTDKQTENLLKITMSCQEVIIVQVTTTQVPRQRQRSPGTTGKTENVGKKSALATGFDAFSGFIPMSLFKIPVTNVPQTFQIALAGKEYSMTCKYNSANEGGWVLDFSDAETAEPIVANIPLVTGVNLLDGLGYLGFEGNLYVYTDGAELAVPTLDNLGTESNLYFETDVVDAGT